MHIERWLVYALLSALSAALVGVTLVLFPLQILVSRWWLSRFRFGPVEWVTRSLTYGKAQPMRRTGVPADKDVARA